jgi:hypothetical protein
MLRCGYLGCQRFAKACLEAIHAARVQTIAVCLPAEREPGSGRTWRPAPETRPETELRQLRTGYLDDIRGHGLNDGTAWSSR